MIIIGRLIVAGHTTETESNGGMFFVLILALLLSSVLPLARDQAKDATRKLQEVTSKLQEATRKLSGLVSACGRLSLRFK